MPCGTTIAPLLSAIGVEEEEEEEEEEDIGLPLSVDFEL